MDRVSKDFLLKAGSVVTPDILAFATTDPAAAQAGAENGQLWLFADGQWSFVIVDWDPAGIASIADPELTALMIGRLGNALAFTASGESPESIDDGGVSPQRRGPLRAVRFIRGLGFVAVGMGRQVYRRVGANRWQRMEDGLPLRRPESVVIGFNAIDGLSPEATYAVGWGGEIWKYDGRTWIQMESPTNLALFDVICTPDGGTFACGKQGLLLRAAGSAWEEVVYDGERTEFRSLCWFRERLFVADGNSVRVLLDGALEIVDFGVGTLVPAHQLHARDGVMISVAGKIVYSTKDGATWTEVPV